MKFSRLIVAGVFVSAACHAAVSAYFAPDPDQVEIAASEGGAVSVIGSLEDLVAGTDGALEAVEAPPEEIQPVENSSELSAVRLNRTLQSTHDTPKAVEVTAATVQPLVKGVTDTRTVTAETVPPETSRAEPQKTAPQALKPAVAAPQEAKHAEARPVEARKSETLESTAPAPPVKPEPPVRKKIAKQQQKKKKVPGADRNARRGGEQITSKTGGSNANGRKGGKSSDGGTEARSNYNGKVLVKLRRAKRYPTQARRNHLRGTATVRFTVARNGAVSGVSLARSSGHTLLDQAALDMVHRAAPMPKVPEDIRGSKLSFTVPVRFSR